MLKIPHHLFFYIIQVICCDNFIIQCAWKRNDMICNLFTGYIVCVVFCQAYLFTIYICTYVLFFISNNSWYCRYQMQKRANYMINLQFIYLTISIKKKILSRNSAFTWHFFPLICSEVYTYV